MDDLRLGSILRAARLRRGWRQTDLARAARVSRATISSIERGHLGRYCVDLVRASFGALDIRLDMLARWRGGDLDRMLNLGHSRLHEAVARVLAADYPDWLMAPEVSFSIYGERGVIDLLLWHPGRRALLVFEFKTDIVDVNALLGTLDRKRRLAWTIARDRGWDPVTVSAWIVVAASRTNERRLAEHRTLLRGAYPGTGRRMRAWLADPVGTVAGLSMWPITASGGRALGPKRRVTQARPTG